MGDAELPRIGDDLAVIPHVEDEQAGCGAPRWTQLQPEFTRRTRPGVRGAKVEHPGVPFLLRPLVEEPPMGPLLHDAAPRRHLREFEKS